ncbi:hypothetical protein GCM10027038_15130 [Arthrobacter bambusae]
MGKDISVIVVWAGGGKIYGHEACYHQRPKFAQNLSGSKIRRGAPNGLMCRQPITAVTAS